MPHPIKIEDVILKHHRRGLPILRQSLSLAFCYDAAKSLFACSRGVVFIITGFYANGVAETDGPVGAYFLANALQKLAFRPLIVTDPFCRDFFSYKPETETLYMPLEGTDPYLEVLNRYNPVCLIAVERCGRNADLKYCNVKNTDISDFTAPLDEFFILTRNTTLTIGIGDGGNEIGMGNLRRTIAEKLDISPCIIDTKHTIIATTSNWGAYGLMAYLTILSNTSLLPDFSDVDPYLDHILSLGSVDGITGSNSKSVDGLEWTTEKEILNELKKITQRQE